MRYIPHTDREIQEMLHAIGVPSVDALFDPIPASAQFRGALNVPAALSEPELMRHLEALAATNTGATKLSFLGAGSYDHHIPPAVDQLLLRSEFYTAYTPYQPEVAQGTLQAIWEFQTLVSELFCLPLANASMYDGASSAAEGAQMARRLTKREKVLVSTCVHPEYRQVIRTYLDGQSPGAYSEVPVGPDGAADFAAIEAALTADVAACVVGFPSFCGTVKNLTPLAELLHARGTLMVTSTTEPYALALAESPGQMGADIATGEGQALACSPNFGGPGVGLFACRGDRRYLQQLPGRLCGETVDRDGKRGFVLTLSTREQHIRRERATSNICTNQGLLALSMTIRTSMLGKVGFQETAKACLSKTHYLRERILALPGYSARYVSNGCFNEFAVRVRGGSAADVVTKLRATGVVPGLDLGRVDANLADTLLIAVTEKHRREDLDRLVSALAEA
jgi:glycine dehydrogenase subunit 1